MSQYPPLQVFNQADQPVGEASLREIYDKGLWHRVVIIAVYDPTGNLLLQRRGAKVATNPNCWDISAAGHVDAAEDYYEAAKRELGEELGIKNVELSEIAHYQSKAIIDGYKLKRLLKIFKVVVPADTTFVIDHEEVTEVRWISPDELKRSLAAQPKEFSDNFGEILSKLQA